MRGVAGTMLQRSVDRERAGPRHVGVDGEDPLAAVPFASAAAVRRTVAEGRFELWGCIMPQVFLSYSRKVQNEVTALARDLGELGHTAWFDEKLAGGQPWWDEILARIRYCDFFIVALSPDTVESVAASREWNYAAELGKPILPVLVTEGVSPALLPGVLQVVQYVDYRSPGRTAALKLVNAISGLPAAEPLPKELPEPPPVPVSYLSSIKEQVDSSEELTFKDQTALVQRLENGAANEDDWADIRSVLARLRKREDLLAAIDKKIDALLARLEGGSLQPAAAKEQVVAPVATSSGSAGAEPPVDGGDGPSAATATTPSATPERSAGSGERFAEDKNPAVALVLSLLIVGVGQFYNGDTKKGLVMLGVAVVLGPVTAGIAWLGMAIWSAIDAYQVAVRKTPLWA